MRHFPLVVICLTLALSAAQKESGGKVPNGLWLADGYGMFVELDASGLHTYQITSISCIPSQTRHFDAIHSSNSTSAFAADKSIITIDRTDDPDTLRMRWDWAAADIILRRTDKAPEACGHKPANSPEEDYAIFWQTFAEQYPFFALRKVDWHAVDQQYRPRVTAATSPADLFQIFRQMIEPLHDVHTALEAREINAEFSGWRPSPNHLSDSDWNRAFSIIESKYVPRVRSYCKGRIQFGMLRNSIGYMRVTTFYDYADGTFADELQCLRRSLDSMFADAGTLSGLVIDVRLNEGGDDLLGVEIACRMTDRKYLAYTKAARNNARLDAPLSFTEKQSVWVVPSPGPRFKGEVALLVGPDTLSAGETFTMALMGREPHVRMIGLNTQGVFSDVLNRSLPNGWSFGLPNEVYYTTDGRAFDAVGVPPDTEVPFFTPEDMKASRDSALEEAIRQLTR